MFIDALVMTWERTYHELPDGQDASEYLHCTNYLCQTQRDLLEQAWQRGHDHALAAVDLAHQTTRSSSPEVSSLKVIQEP